MGTAASWYELNTIEVMFSAGGAANIDTLLQNNPWLCRATEIAAEQRFFHWELDFAAAFDRGGFDLQVGNPPWVRPTLDTPAALLGEFDPWWVLAKKPSNAEKARSPRADADPATGPRRRFCSVHATWRQQRSSWALERCIPRWQEPNRICYRNFMAQTWAHTSAEGIVALVHPPTHLSDATWVSAASCDISEIASALEIY